MPSVRFTRDCANRDSSAIRIASCFPYTCDTHKQLSEWPEKRHLHSTLRRYRSCSRLLNLLKHGNHLPPSVWSRSVWFFFFSLISPRCDQAKGLPLHFV
jgi:hypothetical protein